MLYKLNEALEIDFVDLEVVQVVANVEILVVENLQNDLINMYLINDINDLGFGEVNFKSLELN